MVMSAKLAHRSIVLALIVIAAGAALATHLVSNRQLHSRRSQRVDTAGQAIAGALHRRIFYLEDVADMVGVHDDADVAEFSRYAHVRGYDEDGDAFAVVAVQWVRGSPSGRLAPAGDVPSGTQLTTPILLSPPGRADAARADAAARHKANSAIRAATRHKRVAVSEPLRLANGHAAVYVAVPVVAHRFSGDVSRLESRSAIVGLVDTQHLAAQALEGQSPTALQLRDGSVPLAQLGAAPEKPVSRAVPVPDGQWTVSVAGGSLTPLERALPWAILVVGLGLALAVSRVLRSAAQRRDEAERTARRAHDQLENARADAERRSREDPLTGIFNRRHLNEALSNALAAGGGPTTAILLCDLDHFKRINDEHGHLMGDVVLQATAKRIASVVREPDCLARWGGEEFAILAHGLDRDGLIALAERARGTLTEHPVKVEGIAFPLTLSVGAALASDGLETPDALVDAADHALYAAKAAGRNCVRVWDQAASGEPLGSLS
jgi:diguanylate cyclase (GGDEF)-like protein